MENRRTRQAASLVEVLVVMVVLLIGIFSVIKVFPLGFQYMANAGKRTQAGRLSHNLLEQVKADAANLPESITQSFFTPAGRQTVVGYDPDYDVASGLDTAGTQLEPNPYYRDVNLLRYVTGEPVKVPLPTVSDTVSGSLYAVRLGPIYMDPIAGDPASTSADAEQYLRVTSAPLVGTRVQSEGVGFPQAVYRAQLRTLQNYVIDYGENYAEDGVAARIAFPVAARSRIYLIRYLTESANGIESVESRIEIGAGESGWLDITRPDSKDPVTNVVPGSETVKRLFERLPLGAAWDSDDPYQFQLRYPNIAQSLTTRSVANIGLLLFNPAGATFSEQRSTGGQVLPFVAYVDYAVLDWHILRDDFEVPSVIPGEAGDVALRVSVAPIKQIGETNADSTIYEGLYPASSDPAGADPASNVDLQVFRLDTGEALVAGDYDQRGASTSSGAVDQDADYWINASGRGGTYATGTIYINTRRVPRGTPVRILYKADGDWAVALQKAASTYKVGLNPDDTRFYLTRPAVAVVDLDNDPTTAPLPLGDPTRFGVEGNALYFTRSERGKSMVATLEYIDAGGRRRRTAPVQFTLDSITEFETVPLNATVPEEERRTTYAFAEIAGLMPGIGGGPLQPVVNPTQPGQWRVVGDVRGVSVKARVIWKDENSRRARWRVQDMDSYLTRSVLQ